MIYLNKNESPVPPFSPEELLELFGRAEINRYPREQYQEFVRLYAGESGYAVDQVSLANGSDEWIQKLNILLPQGKILMLDPDFSMYEEYARQFDREIIKVPARMDLSFDLQEILDTITREKPVFFIFSQPNNPLGGLYPQEFIKAASLAMKEVGGWLVVDEAYLNYTDPALRTQVELQDHVMILRTLSKLYGMAGLRIGLIISTAETITWLDSIAHPYPVNSLSLTIASAFLKDGPRREAFFREHYRLSELLKRILHEELDEICEVLPSGTNYVLTRGKPAKQLGDYLKSRGFVLRWYDNPRLTECVRYSLGSEEELRALQTAIRAWKAEVRGEEVSLKTGTAVSGEEAAVRGTARARDTAEVERAAETEDSTDPPTDAAAELSSENAVRALEREINREAGIKWGAGIRWEGESGQNLPGPEDEQSSVRPRAAGKIQEQGVTLTRGRSRQGEWV